MAEIWCCLLIGSTAHATYKNQLLNNQNVLGLARDIDIIPDFEYYEQVLTQYGPLVLKLFEAASSLLIGNLTLDQMRQTLTREIAHIEGLRLTLEAERSAADAERQMAKTRVHDIEDRIREHREELEDKRVSWSDVLAIRYDYGYIHPDIEQDYQDRLLPLAQLIGAYQTSWSRFVGISSTIATATTITSAAATRSTTRCSCHSPIRSYWPSFDSHATSRLRLIFRISRLPDMKQK